MNKNIEFYNYKTNTIVTKDGIIMYPLCKILNQINERNNVNLNSHKILKNPETIAFLQTFTDNTINIDKLFIPNVIDKIPRYTSKLTSKRFISVGRLSEEKGYMDLLEIFNKLHNIS
jgi:glycosyltransferase involved in cell wall biosynthesis